FVAGEPVSGEVGELPGGRSGPGLAGQDGDDGLAPLLVRGADDRDIEDAGIVDQHAFDLGGGDGLPTGEDHILQSVHNVQIAVLVELADVAAVEPARVVEGGRSGFGVVPVTRRDVRPAHADLTAHPRFGDLLERARLDQADLRVGGGNPGGADL